MLIALSVIVPNWNYSNAITIEWVKLGIITQWNNIIHHESEQITTKFYSTEKLTKIM